MKLIKRNILILCLVSWPIVGMEPDGLGKFLSKQLIEAAKGGADEEINSLIAMGADVSYLDGDCTALECAALNEHLSTCKLLIASGANVKLETRRAAIPLFDTVYWGHCEVADVLVQGIIASPADESQIKRFYTLLDCIKFNENDVVSACYTPCIIDALRNAFRWVVANENLMEAQSQIRESRTGHPTTSKPTKEFLMRKYCLESHKVVCKK